MFVLLVAAVVAAESRPPLTATAIKQEAPASEGLLLARFGRYAIERYSALRSGL